MEHYEQIKLDKNSLLLKVNQGGIYYKFGNAANWTEFNKQHKGNIEWWTRNYVGMIFARKVVKPRFSDSRPFPHGY